MSDAIEIVSKIIDFGLGDGLLEWCVLDLLECDAFEDTSMSEQITGIFSNNDKNKVCSANSLVKNISRTIGAILGPWQYVVANLAGNMLECFVVWLKKDGAKEKAEQYELCYSDESNNHPLPYTDKQISRLLKLANEKVTIGNIVNAYQKLCLHDLKNNTYTFYKEGAIVDDIYITHADGYAYVMCASAFSACPCIMNVQHGTIDDPKYKRDENDVIVMNDDGSLAFESEEEEKKYKERYAKHCRILRFKDFVEQQNDIAKIFDDSCFDMRGFSKRSATITAGIVQCFEGTARNIFEKPIMTVTKTKNVSINDVETYQKDYDFLDEKYKEIQKVLQHRSYTNISAGLEQKLRDDEINSILEILKKTWYTQDSTQIVQYVCEANGKSNASSSDTNFYKKYISYPSASVTKICCDSQNNIHCVKDSDILDSDSSLKPIVLENTTTLTQSQVFVEVEKIEKWKDAIYQQRLKATDARNAEVEDSDETFTLTLFDLFRNKIKLIAMIGIVLWFTLLGWKMINGDFGKLDTKEMGMMVLRVSLCFMVVFSDEAKNFIFSWAINTAQGIGLAINDSIGLIRSQGDNTYNQVCTKYGNTSYTTPSKTTYGIEQIADRITNITYSCQSWEKMSQITDKNGATINICEEVDIICPEKEDSKYTNKICNVFFKDYNGNNSSFCKVGYCHNPEDKTSIFVEPTLNGKTRTADENISYSFSCPYPNSISTCTRFGTNGICEEKTCQAYTLKCDNEASTLACSRYAVGSDGIVYNGKNGHPLLCLAGSCGEKNGDFVPTPPFERPYKYVKYYSKESGEVKTLVPKCHKYNKDPTAVVYHPNDPQADLKYSSSTSSYAWRCSRADEKRGYVLDDGFRIKDYIELGMIDTTTQDGVLVFQSLLSDEDQENMSPGDKYDKLLNTVVRTAVATMDSYGNVEEYDFVEDENAAEGMQRAKYRIYLRSKLNYLNKNAGYPYMDVNGTGIMRNYKNVSFWDTMDCKIIQFLTFQGGDSGFTENVEAALANAENGDASGAVTAAATAFLQFVKFLFMAFPFGILVFMLFFAFGAALFMLVARACQQYCVCVFNLVLTIYLSPFVFVLWLFDQTKGAMKNWLDDLKSNVLGACVPFVTITLFLFILDWILFGDADQYKAMSMFTPDGNISNNCYDGHEEDAPIACLSIKLIKRFSIWSNFLSLITFQWGKIFNAETFTWMGYLVLRLLFGAAVIVVYTLTSDQLEEKIYNIVGKPNTDIGVGFNESAKSSIIAGGKAGLAAGSFALDTMKGTFTAAMKIGKMAFNAANTAGKMIGGALSALGNAFGSSGLASVGNAISGAMNKAKNAVLGAFNKVSQAISRAKQAVSKAFGTVGDAIKKGFNKIGEALNKGLNYVISPFDGKRKELSEQRIQNINKSSDRAKLNFKRKVNDAGKNARSKSDIEIRKNDTEYESNLETVNKTAEEMINSGSSEESVKAFKEKMIANLNAKREEKNREIENNFNNYMNKLKEYEQKGISDIESKTQEYINNEKDTYRTKSRSDYTDNEEFNWD